MTIRSFLCLLLLGVFTAAPAGAQDDADERSSANPAHNLPTFAPIEFSVPNQFRAASGRTGPQYWQNEADYTIDVTLTPENHRLDGTLTITYTNNSPQDLDYLWVQLDQNLFDPESRGARITGPSDRFRGAFEGGGYDISSVQVMRGEQTPEPEYLIDDTRMRIALDEPLAAEGGTLNLSMDFAFTVPKYGADRMGRFDAAKGTVYEIAQWYPRMFVFDDVNGWNVLPYLGQGEYYLEYGTFELNLTVPRDMIVTASGTLQNPEEVLTDQQRRRLDQARQSEETVTIISREEAGQSGTRPSGSGPLTWRFRAENVRDASWAASRSFIWDAARAETGDDEPALAQSFYPEEGIGNENSPGWERSTQYAQHSIEHYSKMWEPYPYPSAINVAGVVGGMEYPQIVFCSVRARGPALFGVTDHELGHEWFPMIVGSDERRHVWMDEGLNTFLNHYSTIDFYDQSPSQQRRALIGRAAEGALDRIADQPIMTYSDRIRGEDLGFLGYRKPAAGLVILREYVLGKKLFDTAFRAYIDRWAYKHPQPADFFRTIEDVAGEDLDWFWRGWFFSNDRLDQAIADVSSPEEETTQVTIANQEGLVMPAELRITYADGSSERRRIPVEAFFTGDRFTTVIEGRQIQRIVLDPRGMLPDIERSNNGWTSSGGIGAPQGQKSGR